MPKKSTSDLRKGLGKAQYEKNTNPVPVQSSDPWGNRWTEAIKAYSRGWTPPERRYPVYIGEEGIFSTAEMVKDFLGLSETPRTVETSWCDFEAEEEDVGRRGEVVVCDISEPDCTLLEERAKVPFDPMKIVWFRGARRMVKMARALRVDGEKEDSPEPEPVEDNPDDHAWTVLVGGESVIRSPEHLQEVLGLQEAPQLIRTKWAPLPKGLGWDNPADMSQEVFICDIPYKSWLSLKDIAERTDDYKWMAWFRGEKVWPTIVRSLQMERAPGESGDVAADRGS